MKTALSVIVTLVITIIGAYFTNYFSSEKADVRYALSERFPTGLVSTKPAESLQHLEIKNMGKTEAKHIQIVISARIASYELLKHSKADIFKEYKTPDSLEIIYPSLPPQGSIKMLVKSMGTGIDGRNLNISHSKGRAEEAFERNSIATLLTNAFMIAFLFATALSLVSTGRNMQISDLESSANYATDKVLKKKKPFYISEEKWLAIRKSALENKIERDWGPVGEKSSSYILLNVDKPDYLDEEEWHKLRKSAERKLTENLLTAAYRYHSSKNVLSLLGISKPKYFNEKEWLEIIETLNKAYFVMLRQETMWKYKSVIGIQAAMKTMRQPTIMENMWNDYMDDLATEYYYALLRALESEEEPNKYLATQDLTILSREKRISLEARAYALEMKKLPSVYSPNSAADFIKLGKPTWIKHGDYEHLESQARETISRDDARKKGIAMLGLLNSIINREPVVEKKPEILSEEEWAKIVKIDRDIRLAIKENSLQRTENEKLKSEVTAKREKVIRQLRIINEVLSDPSALSRIEEDENPFASGNYVNLKRVAEILLKS